jgi:hypothetical protein
MIDGTEEKIIKQVIQCGGFKKLVTIETCQQACNYFDGIHKEPVSGRNKKGENDIVGHNYYIKCIRPRMLPFQAIGEVLPEIDSKKE